MTAPNVRCILWISSDLQIRGAGWIELTLLLHAHKLHRLRDIHRARMLCTAQSSATASLVAVSDTAQNAVSVDHKHLSTESLHSLPWGREQDSSTSAAYQMEMSTNLEEMRWSLSGFATACLFSPACLCLLREGSVCTSCFWIAELRYCLLNAELCRIWTSFRNCNRKKIHCYYFEMLFVPMPNPAGFIFMCLFVISLFSANPTTSVFCVSSAGSAAAVH